jgi:hypothetical protein
MGCTSLGDSTGETVRTFTVSWFCFIAVNRRFRSYLEKMIPHIEKEPAILTHAYTLDVPRDHQLDHLSPLKLPHHSTTALSRLGLSRLMPHNPADTTTTIIGSSRRYTHKQEEGSWLSDLPRPYTSSQEPSTQAIPRISTRSFIPRIRESEYTEQPQRLADDCARSQRSYPTLSSLVPTPGQLHTAPEIDFSTEFARVKHEPDGDSAIPPLRLGWAYETRVPPSTDVSVAFLDTSVVIID